jgi:alkanesulfonate monooxygenase SsuD/methylene tetrahydromethanopterin reductase-like flavin-dependent oxidoreductase (luciferase family)
VKLHAFLLGQTNEPTIDTGPLYQSLIDDAKHVEALGYDGVWLAEHHFSNYAMVPNSLTLLAAMARETRTIRLGTSVILLSLRNPLYVAEEIAMVDQLSNGRLEIGFGRGQPHEFDRMGIDYGTSLDRLTQGLDMVSHLFKNQDMPFKSSMYALPDVTMVPSPRQLPHPPFWVACHSPEAMGMAIDHGYSIVAGVGNKSPEHAQKMSDMFHAACGDRNVDPKTRRFGLQTHGYVIDSAADEETITRSGGYLHRLQVRLREKRKMLKRGVNDGSGTEPGEPNFSDWSSAAMIGSRDHLAKQVKRFESLGATDLFVTYRFGEVTTEGTHRSFAAVANAFGKSRAAAAVA